VGLLPPVPIVIRGKAAKLLGVDENDDDDVVVGPRIELLREEEEEEEEINNNSSSLPRTPPIDKDGDDNFDPYAIRLLRSPHASYLLNALTNPLSRGFVSLDASHPWMVYWCLHSLDLLGHFDIVGENTTSGLGGGGRGGYGFEEIEVLQKGQLLQRIVSTVEHCWTDVPLSFDVDEVANDARLKKLCEEQSINSCISNAEKEKEKKISITGGGFGGGPQQMPHCAPTYAAVLSLCIVASLGLERKSKKDHPYRAPGRRAMEVLTKRRLQLYAYFLTLRERETTDDSHEEGRTAFRMQHDGEIDVRASYCLLAPCYLLGLLDTNNDNNIDNNNPLQRPSISRHIASCQTFEGGFGAEPSNEAHGGYTFCALAALRILGSVSAIDVGALSGWLARRQMGFEGGFQGRTNKLVDGCYSFWQGGAVAVLDGWYGDNIVDDGDDEEEGDSTTASMTEGGSDDASKTTTTTSKEKKKSSSTTELSYDEIMLQRYILLCAQDVNGGLRDKPSKPKDFYHSCYNLSGLSVAQHALVSWPQFKRSTPSTSSSSCADKDDEEEKTSSGGDDAKEGKEESYNRLWGDVSVNIVGRTDPVINIRVERVKFMLSQW